MRDFLNYGDSLDIKFLIITVIFIIIWKVFIEKRNKKMKDPVRKFSSIILVILLMMLIINLISY